MTIGLGAGSNFSVGDLVFRVWPHGGAQGNAAAWPGFGQNEVVDGGGGHIGLLFMLDAHGKRFWA